MTAPYITSRLGSKGTGPPLPNQPNSSLAQRLADGKQEVVAACQTSKTHPTSLAMLLLLPCPPKASGLEASRRQQCKRSCNGIPVQLPTHRRIYGESLPPPRNCHQ